MPNADDFLAMSRKDPQRVLVDGAAHLAGLDPAEHRERAVTLRALSLAARNTNQIVESIGYARLASDTAREGGLERLALMATLTETGSIAISGDLDGALAIIEGVLTETDDEEIRAEFDFQKAAVLANMGHLGEAIVGFEELLPVYESLGDTESLILTLNRLGRLLTSTGDLVRARRFLERSLAMARQDNDLASIPGILHNLGLLSSYQGDVPEALARLYESDTLYMEVSGADAPQHVARCEVLMSVGLYEEALETAKTIAKSSADRHDGEHELNALMVAARAALLAERYAEAVEFADRASRVVGETDDLPILYEARVIAIEASLGLDGPSRDLLAEAMQMADEMVSEGLLFESVHTRSIAMRISFELGDEETTERLADQVIASATGPIELRLQGPLARSRLAVIRGDRGRALRSARNGLTMIDRFQEALGSTDLRLGVEKRGREFGDLGLQLALDSGRPRSVLEWVDRTRARALRLRPVTPADDGAVGSLLADLRRVDAELREPEERTNRTLLARRRKLQQALVSLERTQAGAGAIEQSFSVGSLIDTLGDVALYEIGVAAGRMFAIHVRAGRSKLVELADFEAAQREIAQLRFAMRRAARRGRLIEPAAMERVASHMFHTDAIEGEHVVIVPPPELMAIPWAALPPLRDRSVVVAPSAEMWWKARRQTSSGDGVLVAGGPDLDQAEDEVQRISALHKGSTGLPPGATVDEVKGGMDGAGIAHIACHASFQFENPMFSSLRLGDGDLNVYDLERLDKAPEVVVLSACDSGYTETRAGDELAGLTSALLSMGTRSVIASVGLVPDNAGTTELMVDLHRGLVSGLTPSQALAAAQAKAFEDPDRFVSAASFVCVGA